MPPLRRDHTVRPPPSLLTRLLRYRPGALASSTAFATSFQLLRVGCQALTVILLARALGAQSYGMLIGYAGLAMIIGTLGWLGGSYLMMEGVAGDPDSFGRLWAATRHSVALLAALLLPAYLLATPAFLHLPVATPLLTIGLSEILCYPLVYAGGFAFQTRNRQGWANGAPAIMAVLRLAAAALFTVFGDGHLATYACLHLAASLLGALLVLTSVQRILRPRNTYGRYRLNDIRRGAAYLAGGVSLNAYGEADKIMAVRMLGASLAGTYAIAYRVISMLAMPAISLALVAQVRMFQHARARQLADLRKLSGYLAAAMLAYSLLAASLVWLAAPYLTLLLGQSYAAVADVVRVLALLLPLTSLRTLAVTVMTGLGRPALRAALEAIATACMATTIALAAPRFGLTGVALSVIAVEALLLATMTGMATHLLRDVDQE